MQNNRSIYVLLIEDDPIHAKLIRRAFNEQQESSTLQIEHVDDGEAALQRIIGQTHDETDGTNPRPDLVLLDLRLPTIDGFDILETVRACERTRSIPIVVVSTSDHVTDVNRSYTLGANAYVCKPPDFEQFSDKLSRLSHFWARSVELPTA